jgi:eukaryotic-like serine/threonine-protein kinase
MQPGMQLGHYTIISAIGKGGMGEVWRALDRKLEREVAIKTLPEEFAKDGDRLSRFEREAKLLASLNHSNIGTIHGLEEREGTRFLVLELVEGETLADRLNRGAIPVDEALPVAKQIADALEAAHEKGIVHRDLKPANIKITPEGKVKVLDFGLAKIFEPARTDDPASSNSPTLMSGSMVGVLVGTAAYMSPEQARGRTTDRSSDIWSFGCVLYEMLTGKQAFAGETITDILGGIVKLDPDWNALPDNLPPAVRSLLRRCLRKDRKLRLHDIGDARIEIEEALTAPAAQPVSSATKAPVKRVRERLAWGLAGLLAVAAIALAIPAYRYFTPVESRAVQFEIPMPEKTSFPPGAGATPWPSVSPDGRYVAFVLLSNGTQQLWVRSLDSLKTQALAGTEGIGMHAFWSPDSRFIGFFADGKLKKIAVSGGPAQILCDAPLSNSGHGAWGSQDVIVFALNPPSTLYRVPAAGGVSEVLRSPDKSRQEAGFLFPYFLPNGKDLLFLSQNANPAQSEIQSASVDGGASKSLLKVNSRIEYKAPGHLFFARDGTLMVQPFDAKNLALSGEMAPLAQFVANHPTGDAAFGVSDTGTLVYKTDDVGAYSQLAWFDRTGKILGTEPTEGMFPVNPSISPDGKRIAFRREETRNIWVRDVVRGTNTRLTFEAGSDSFPVWSPDGNTIVFASLRNDRTELFRKSSNGAGSEERLNQPATGVTDWSRDGRFILYWRSEANTRADVWVLPTTGEQKAFPVLNSKFAEIRARFSPDAKYIAYVSNESGRNEIYVQTFPTSGGRWQVSVNGGEFVEWRSDGKELFFSTPDRKIMSVDVKAGSTFEAGVPRVLFEMPNATSPQFAVTPDGQRFLVTIPREQTQTATITTVLNWPALLKK